jgi:hypothetical protein
MILQESEARKRIAALPLGREQRIKWAGFELPDEAAETGLLVVGGTGAGKTTMLSQTLDSLLQNFQNGAKHQAIIFDPKGELLRLLRARPSPPKLIIFDITDGNSAAWDIAGDAQSPTDSRILAEFLVPKTKSTQPGLILRAVRERNSRE